MAEAGLLPIAAWLGPALAPLAAMPFLARRRGMALLPIAPLPALVVALWIPDGQVDLPGLLLGSRLGVDAVNRIFLLFTAALWLAAGLHATGYFRDDARRVGFGRFWLAAMAGNLGLVLAQDAASFYVFFALMSFASYGLVVHARTPEAMRAGRVYIALVVLGELALFAAIAIAWQATGSLYFDAMPALAHAPQRDAVIALALVGFGIKLGAVPLHVWLPLAHPAAPAPASAVLSGAMIKAGLLGWINLLPLGGVAEPGWGLVLIALGLVAAAGGALVGAMQATAKAALAYSSISQMGYVVVAVGTAMTAPGAAPAAVAAASLYAFHHAFAKAALFLGCALTGASGRWGRGAWCAGMLVAALALAGAPLSSGYAAKTALKAALPGGLEALAAALALAAAGTVLLMLRLGGLLYDDARRASHAPNAAMWTGFGLLVAGTLAGWALVGSARDMVPADASSILGSVAPLIVGLAAGALLVALVKRLPRLAALRVPAGDVIIPVLDAVARVERMARVQVHRPRAHLRPPTVPQWPALESAEAGIAKRTRLLLALIVIALIATLLAHAWT